MDIEYQDGVAWLRMRTGKANAIGSNFLKLLGEATAELAASSAKVVVLTGDERNFCAGLNLVELWDYNRQEMTDFIGKFSSTFLRFTRLPQVVIAAVNGNAIAGGAILAQTAEYRLMVAEGAKIGVNEVNLGIPFPRQALAMVASRIARDKYFEVIYQGKLFTPAEALQMGLIDEICSTTNLALRAAELAQDLAGKNRRALARIKQDLNAGRLEELEKLGTLGDTEFVDVWFSEDTRAQLGAMIETIKNKAKSMGQ
jgi:enoyl-CoA hydratase/carnithine racemase